MKIKELTLEPLLESRHGMCPGCGPAIAMAHVLSILSQPLPSGKTKRIRVAVIPASCWSLGSGYGDESYLGVNIEHTPFAASATVGEGISIMSRRQGRSETDTTLVWAGDGGSFDIGLGYLSGAASRNADILYVINDNQIYGNTGAQQSGATPYGARTMTSPAGKKSLPKDMLGIMRAHHVSYFASMALCPTTMDDFYAKVRRAADRSGFRCLHLLSVCPPGWKCEPDLAPELAGLAVSTRVFPLVELADGVFRVTEPKREKPVEEYLALQGRFQDTAASPDEMQVLRDCVEEQWKYILSLTTQQAA